VDVKMNKIRVFRRHGSSGSFQLCEE